MAAARTGTDDWSLFLRQQRLKDQLRRLRNNFKDCHCPLGCRGGPQNHVGIHPVPPPAQPLHGPYVRPDSAMPRTTARTLERRDPNCRVLAEARGTSDILLYRRGTRATLRMSLQVHTDVALAGRFGYYAEMFLTEPGHEEEFIGLINSWHVERRTDEWEDTLLAPRDTQNADLVDMRSFMMYIYGLGMTLEDGSIPRGQNGQLLPVEGVRDQFAAPWAILSGDSDILYIPAIWMDRRYTGQRIIDQGFELFFRLMTGGTLPEPYNLTRPLSVLLEPGALQGSYANDWNDSAGARMDPTTQVHHIARAYARNGFMRLQDDNMAMGRRVEPGVHPAAPGDVNMDPPDPPDSDPNTPSPRRRRRPRDPSSSVTPESPSQWTAMGPGAKRVRLPAWLLERRRGRGK